VACEDRLHDAAGTVPRMDVAGRDL
jgi:hypothetical protein